MSGSEKQFFTGISVGTSATAPDNDIRQGPGLYLVSYSVDQAAVLMNQSSSNYS